MTLAAFGSIVQADTLADLDKALTEAAAWKYGDKDTSMKTIESTTFAAGKDAALRGPVEDKLIAALKSSKSVDLRRFICRQLRTIGTVKSVPVLAGLLSDADLTHGARYALGRIADPKAAIALHDAMGKTSGKIQAGIIVTLGKRGYIAATGDMVKLFGSSDKIVAKAAIRGVGLMGTTDAARSLLGARTSASGEIRKRITDAMLDCADRLTKDGKSSEAATIYKVLYTPKETKVIRLAALRGLAQSQGVAAVNTLTVVIKGDDAQMQASAIAYMTEVKDPSATKALVDLLGAVKPEAQTLVLRSLAARSDKSACGAVTKAVASEDKNVKAAALEALGAVGGAGSVDLLIANAATGGCERCAEAGLMIIKGDGVDDAMIKAVASDDPKIATAAVKALKARGCKKAIDAIFKAAVAKDSGLRRTAASALGTLAGEKDIDRMLAILVKPADPKDRAGLEHAVGVAFLSIADKGVCADKVAKATHSAGGEAKASLIRLLAKAPTAKALGAVKAMTKDQNAAVKDAAVRTLASWPNAAPANDVIAMAKATSDKKHRILLLRGYIRMAGTVEDPTEMCIAAMKLADGARDKQQALSVLGQAGSIKAFNLAAGYLDDKDTFEEAAMAAARIGEKLKGSKARQQVKTVLQKIVKTTKNRSTKKMAEKTIKGIKK